MLKRKLSEFSGVSMFRGTVCLDADDWTFEQAVRAEANSRNDAILARMQTTVSPSNGYWVSFAPEADREMWQLYEAEVLKELELLSRG